MSKTIGLDLGSTNSCFAVFEGNEAKVITNADGSRTTPSIVAFTKNGEELVGQAAARQMVTNSKNTIYLVKRLIGRKFAEVKDQIKNFAYEIVEAPNGDCRVKINDKLLSPEEISAKIIAKAKKDAESYLGDTVTGIVVTVPAYYNDSQRSSVKDACRIAGLECKRIINEPTAACLAYSSGKSVSKKIAVFDFGGSTFDISILDVADGVVEVLATNGNTMLGGHDIDVKLMDYVISQFKSETGIDLSRDPMAMQRVKDECEKAKCALSTAAMYDMSLPFITADATGPRHLQVSITQAKLNEIADDVIEKAVEPCKKCLADSRLEKVDEVLMVGGQTRMPAIQALAKRIFNVEPNLGINPDEAVGLGAAVQAGILSGEKNDILLLDVTPLTLSIETMGGIATPMIERNTTIPTKKTEVFSTAADYQSTVTVRICQGERKMFNDNKVLGTFNLDGIPPAPRGVPQIEICLDLDANGILNVTARDLGTKKEQHITITGSSGLSNDEIERAKSDAELHKAEDEKRASLIQEKNQAESAAYASEKSAKDNKDKLGEELSKKILDAVAAVRSTLSGDDLDAIRSKVAELAKANEEAAKVLYPTGSSSQQNAPNFSKEDLEKMKKDPRFASMFGKGGPFSGSTSTSPSSSSHFEATEDNSVDAEVVE